MKVEAIPNRGVASMGPQLEHSLGWAREADIASAFVTNASLRRLEAALSHAHEQSRSLKVRVLIGLYQRFTPPSALDTLLRLRREFPGKLYARVARNERFHWKLYAFRKGTERRFFVGSANLTQDGMTAEGELCVKISSAARDVVSKSLETEFDKLWQDEEKSVTLDGVLLGKYRTVARPAQRYTSPNRDRALKDVLVTPERFHPEPSRKTTKWTRPRVCFAPYDVSEETVDIVESETTWDRRGWGYTAYEHKRDFDRHRRAPILLHVTQSARPREYRLSFVTVKSEAVLDTADGKYFVAHARVPYSRERRYDEEVKRTLARVGLKWGKIKSESALNSEQLEELCRLLHVRPEKLLRLGTR